MGVAAAAILPAIGIGVWLLEFGYAFLIWPRQTRNIWLALTCAGIGVAMGMHLFAMVMIVLNVAAFGPASACAASESSRLEVART